MTMTYARLTIQYTKKYQTVFSVRFDKQDEDDRVLDETDFHINLNNDNFEQKLMLIILTLNFN